MTGNYGRDEVMTNWANGLEGGGRRMFEVFNEMYPETKDMDPLPLSEYSLHAIGTPIVEVGEDLRQHVPCTIPPVCLSLIHI